MQVTVFRDLFEVAEEIAEQHLPRRPWRPIKRLVEKIRLRTAIYNALAREREKALRALTGGSNG